MPGPVPLPPSDGGLDLPHDTGPPLEVGSQDVPPSLKATGQPCGQGSECSSSRCSDGVCGDKDCAGCSTCTKALTGKSDGTCAAVPNGLDPHLACGTSCSSGTLTTLVCNGSGTCATGSSGTCPGNVQCASATECLGAGCSTDTQCATGYRCNAGACVLKKTLGVACVSGGECSSGNCVDGFCCGSSSCPQCQACTGSGGTCAAATSQNGQQCTSSTYCYNGACTPCTANSTCDTGNPCDIGKTSCSTGLSVCNKVGNQSAGYSCGADQTCTGSTLTSARTCNGSGTCVGGTTSNCPFGCSGNTCFPGLTNGQSCSTSSQCQSGHCSLQAQKTCQQDCGTGSACCDQSDCPSGNLCDDVGLCESCGVGIAANCCPFSPKCQPAVGHPATCVNIGQPSTPYGYCLPCGGSGEYSLWLLPPLRRLW